MLHELDVHNPSGLRLLRTLICVRPLVRLAGCPPQQRLVRQMLKCNPGVICEHEGPCSPECGGDHYAWQDGACLRCGEKIGPCEHPIHMVTGDEYCLLCGERDVFNGTEEQSNER